MKKLFLTIGLFFIFLGSLHAQDKYDYAMVTYRLHSKFVEVSINGDHYEKNQLSEPITSNYCMGEAGLKQVKKMNEEGWELFQTSTTQMELPVFIFYLRRKIN